MPLSLRFSALCGALLHLFCKTPQMEMATITALQVLHTKPACSSAVGNDGIIIDPPQSKSTVINALPCVFHADSSEIKQEQQEARQSADQKVTTEGTEIWFYLCVCCSVSQKQLQEEFQASMFLALDQTRQQCLPTSACHYPGDTGSHAVINRTVVIVPVRSLCTSGTSFSSRMGVSVHRVICPGSFLCVPS